MKKAMSMIEIIFVIAIIGVLAGVAIPKIFVGRDDAQILKLKEEYVLIITNLEQYSQSMLYEEGSKKFPKNLYFGNQTGIVTDKENIVFNRLKECNPSKTNAPCWISVNDGTGENTVSFYFSNKKSIDFKYSQTNKSLDCQNINECNKLKIGK